MVLITSSAPNENMGAEQWRTVVVKSYSLHKKGTVNNTD